MTHNYTNTFSKLQSKKSNSNKCHSQQNWKNQTHNRLSTLFFRPLQPPIKHCFSVTPCKPAIQTTRKFSHRRLSQLTQHLNSQMHAIVKLRLNVRDVNDTSIN